MLKNHKLYKYNVTLQRVRVSNVCTSSAILNVRRRLFRTECFMAIASTATIEQQNRTSCAIISPDFNQNNFLDRFSQKFPIPNFTEIRPVAVMLTHAHGWTDMKLKDASRDYVNCDIRHWYQSFDIEFVECLYLELSLILILVVIWSSHNCDQ